MGIVWDPTRCLVLAVPEQQKFFSPSRGWRLQMALRPGLFLGDVFCVDMLLV